MGGRSGAYRADKDKRQRREEPQPGLKKEVDIKPRNVLEVMMFNREKVEVKQKPEPTKASGQALTQVLVSSIPVRKRVKKLEKRMMETQNQTPKQKRGSGAQGRQPSLLQ